MKLCIWPRYELHEGDLRVHLDPQEGLMMTAFLSHPEVTTDILWDTLWPDPDDMPDTWYRSLLVRMCGLRHKLRPFGMTITTRGPATFRSKNYGWHLQELHEERLAA